MNTPYIVNKEDDMIEHRWQHPETGVFKVNVDASVFPSAQTLTIGIVMRDHMGTFITGKNLHFSKVGLVFEAEAEAVGVLDGVSWVKEQWLHNV